MKPRDLLRYCRDLGWNDPLELPAAPHPGAEPSTPAELESLDSLAAFVARCTRCRLHETRRNAVFGEGSGRSAILFVGEGPGAEEDRSGRPFVGQAGQLLDAMIVALGFERDEVYIANTVKCRPPANRDPSDDEMAACAPFLDRQIEILRPTVIVALGRVAAQRLTGSNRPVGALRGRWAAYRGVPLLPTFHPAYLLRSPSEKRRVWEDLKKVKEKLKRDR